MSGVFVKWRRVKWGRTFFVIFLLQNGCQYDIMSPEVHKNVKIGKAVK